MDETCTSKSISSTRCSRALWNRYAMGYIPVIPDIKLKSSGEGDLIQGRDPLALAKAFEAEGAPVISVVTEAKHYGGSLELLEEIANVVSIPILRKDFITNKEELRQSAEQGASGVLLISSILDKKQLIEVIDEAVSMGLEPLVETHSEDEIRAIQDLNLTLLGINNRDITQWEMDDGGVDRTERLTEFAPKGALVVSESSISSPNEAQRAIEAGAHCTLIGTAILKAKDSVEMYRKFSNLRRLR